MTGDATSTVVNIQDFDDVAVEFVWTGTPTGTFEVDCSLDYDSQVAGSGTWVPLPLSPAPAAAGAAGSILIDLTQLGSPYLRVRYLHSGSTGTLDVYAFAKALG